MSTATGSIDVPVPLDVEASSCNSTTAVPMSTSNDVEQFYNEAKEEEMLRQCQTIIYLNNCAVTLLGTYSNHIAAIRTMKDALELLSQSSSSSSSSLSSSSTNHELQRRNAIQNASRSLHIEEQKKADIPERLLPPQQQRKVSEPNEMNDIGVVVMSCHYNPYDAYHRLATLRTSKVAIRIDTPQEYCGRGTSSPSPSSYNTTFNQQQQHHQQQPNSGEGASDTEQNGSTTDYFTNLHVVQSILVYNYGIAHRCCMTTTIRTTTPPISSVDSTATTGSGDESNSSTPSHNHHNTTSSTAAAGSNRVGTFCLQVFQYAEQLLLPALEKGNATTYNNTSTGSACCDDKRLVTDQQNSAGLSSVVSNHHNPFNCSTGSYSYLLLYRFVLTRNLMMISCKMGILLCELYKQTLDPIESEILMLRDSQPQQIQSSKYVAPNQQHQDGNETSRRNNNSNTDSNTRNNPVAMGTASILNEHNGWSSTNNNASAA